MRRQKVTPCLPDFLLINTLVNIVINALYFQGISSAGEVLPSSTTFSLESKSEGRPLLLDNYIFQENKFLIYSLLAINLSSYFSLELCFAVIAEYRFFLEIRVKLKKNSTVKFKQREISRKIPENSDSMEKN